jgi:hypothetical protein
MESTLASRQEGGLIRAAFGGEGVKTPQGFKSPKEVKPLTNPTTEESPPA